MLHQRGRLEADREFETAVTLSRKVGFGSGIEGGSG